MRLNDATPAEWDAVTKKPSKMEVEIIEETTTDWGTCEFKVPCHTYVLNKYSKKLVGYFPVDTGKFIMLATPMSFTKSKRKFNKIGVRSMTPLIEKSMQEHNLCL